MKRKTQIATSYQVFFSPLSLNQAFLRRETGRKPCIAISQKYKGLEDCIFEILTTLTEADRGLTPIERSSNLYIFLRVNGEVWKTNSRLPGTNMTPVKFKQYTGEPCPN